MRSRNNVLYVYLSDKEQVKLNRKIEESGLSASTLIRRLIMDCQIRARPPNEYLQLVREINAVGNNINQIARIANAEQHISADRINEAVKKVDSIMDMIRRCYYGNNKDMDGEIKT